MKVLLHLIFTFFLMSNCFAQTTTLPKDWLGKWNGDLYIYSLDSFNKETITKVPMEMEISVIDSSTWKWMIYYKIEHQEPRNYELQFTNKGWQIDEKNGIVIPQKLLNGKLMSTFVVGNNQINCSYELQKDQLQMEIFMVNVQEDKAIKTGLNTNEIPQVIVHPTMNYQKALLNKIQ